MDQNILNEHTLYRRHIKTLSSGFLGVVALLVLISIPAETKAAQLCEAYAPTLTSAKSYFQKRCKTTFTPSKGHYCNKTSAGKYKCSNGVKTADDPTPPVVSKPVKSGSCKTIWAPSEQSLAAAPWASGTESGGKVRVKYDSNTDSVKISHLPSLPDMQLSDYRANGVTSNGGNVVRMTTQVYVSPGFKGQAGSRMAIGFRGGPTPQSAAGAGEGGADQDGWSIRVNYSANVAPVLYSYHLNRAEGWGSGPRLSKGLPTGQWMTIVVEAKLNTPGVANGSAFLKVYDSKGKLYGEVSMDKKMWRKNSSWKYIGVYLTDKIPARPSQQQYILYRNYDLSVGQGSAC